MTTSISDLRNMTNIDEVKQIKQLNNMKVFAKTMEQNMNTLSDHKIPPNYDFIDSKKVIQPNVDLLRYNNVRNNSITQPYNYQQRVEQNPRGEKMISNISSWFSYIKEPIIITIIFTLLAHKKVTKIISKNILFFNDGKHQLISLLIRGFVFSLLLIFIRHKLL